MANTKSNDKKSRFESTFDVDAFMEKMQQEQEEADRIRKEKEEEFWRDMDKFRAETLSTKSPRTKKYKPAKPQMAESVEQTNGLSVRIVESANGCKGDEISLSSEENKTVQSEHQCTTAPGKPIPPIVSKAATATAHQSSALDNPIAKEADEIPVSAPVIETSVAETHSQSKPDSSEPSTVEQSKKSRISAKKVDADFEELCREFIHPASLGEKKPVFLPFALRDRLDDIARLSGDRRVSASHIAINIISRWIDDNRDTLNRKISNKDFSI